MFRVLLCRERLVRGRFCAASFSFRGRCSSVTCEPRRKLFAQVAGVFVEQPSWQVAWPAEIGDVEPGVERRMQLVFTAERHEPPDFFFGERNSSYFRPTKTIIAKDDAKVIDWDGSSIFILLFLEVER